MPGALRRRRRALSPSPRPRRRRLSAPARRCAEPLRGRASPRARGVPAALHADTLRARSSARDVSADVLRVDRARSRALRRPRCGRTRGDRSVPHGVLDTLGRRAERPVPRPVVGARAAPSACPRRGSRSRPGRTRRGRSRGHGVGARCRSDGNVRRHRRPCRCVARVRVGRSPAPRRHTPRGARIARRATPTAIRITTVGRTTNRASLASTETPRRLRIPRPSGETSIGVHAKK